MLGSDKDILRLLIEIRDALRANARPSPQGEAGDVIDNGVSVDDGAESSRQALAAAQAQTAAAIDEMRVGIRAICALLEERL